MTVKKYMEKLRIQNRTNPGHKSKYVPLPRGRAATHKLKTAYNRQKSNLDTRATLNYWRTHKGG